MEALLITYGPSVAKNDKRATTTPRGEADNDDYAVL